MKLPFKKSKNLTAILGTFDKTLKDLEALINRNVADISANVAKVEAINAENAQLVRETEQADRVSARIKELVS